MNFLSINKQAKEKVNKQKHVTSWKKKHSEKLEICFKVLNKNSSTALNLVCLR